MAVTQISDVIVPEIWTPYMIQRSLALSKLYQSGIVQTDAELNSLIRGGGKLYNLPYWSNLTGNSVVGSDDPNTAITPVKLTAGQDVAHKHFRNGAWSTMDLAGALAGSDPAGAIAELVAEWWNQDFQATLIASLNGVLADNIANDSGDMVVDISNDNAIPQDGIPASDKISATAILAAKQTMGDQAGNLTAIAFHSVLHTELQRQNLIAYVPNDQANVGWGTYLGYSVVVDDTCPAVVGTNRITYTSYLFGRGAVAFAEDTPKMPTETQRDALAGNGSGQETLVNRRHFILHPRGIRFISGSVAGVSPTNSELAAAANWNRVYDRKAVRIVAIKSNG